MADEEYEKSRMEDEECSVRESYENRRILDKKANE